VTSAAQPSASEFDWEAAGRALGAKLDRLHAIAVLGSNDADTACVALGIAKLQSRKRRVAIGDLLGDAPPLQSLVKDDTHGLADVFEYGLSLDRVAQKVENEGELYVLPSGAFISDHAEVMANRRWSKLAAGFREEQALLLITANVSTPDIENLVQQLEGAILVGNAVPARLPVARVLGAVRGPDPVLLPSKAPTPPPRPKYVVRAPMPLWKMLLYVFSVMLVMAAAVGYWWLYRPFANAAWAPDWLRGPPRADAPLIVRGLDTAGVAGADSMMATARYLGLATAADSAARAPYGVVLITFNTQAGALLELSRNSSTLRAGTFTPVLIRGTPWFRVVAGAYPDSAAAAALLDTLRARGASDAGRAVIEPFPYALLIERDVADGAVAAKVSALQARNIPAYALAQRNNTARVYAGAFRAPAEAVRLYEDLKTAGIQTSLVYRTGRVY
jgi:hypothetical protein